MNQGIDRDIWEEIESELTQDIEVFISMLSDEEGKAKRAIALNLSRDAYHFDIDFEMLPTFDQDF